MRRRGRGHSESLLLSVHIIMRMHTVRGPIRGRIAPKSSLLHVAWHGRRRKRGLLGVPAKRRPSGGVPGVVDIAYVACVGCVAGVAGVAGTLSWLALIQPVPEREKDKDEKDAAADSAADDRPGRVRASGRSI